MYTAAHQKTHIKAILEMRHLRPEHTHYLLSCWLTIGNSHAIGGGCTCCNTNHLVEGRVLKSLYRLWSKKQLQKCTDHNLIDIPGQSQSAILWLPHGILCLSKESLVPEPTLANGHQVCPESFCEHPQKPSWPLFEHSEVCWRNCYFCTTDCRHPVREIKRVSSIRDIGNRPHERTQYDDAELYCGGQ